MPRCLQAVLLYFLCFPLLSAAVEVTDGPHVEVADTTATIRWKTDVECGTRVRYGLKADQLDRKAENAVAINHEVTLTSLTPGVTYHFSVGTARVLLKSGSFTTSGNGNKADTAPQSAPPPVKPKETTQTKPTSPPVYQAPPLRQIWGDLDSLEDHYERHGADFQATSAEDYARKSWFFLQRAMDESLPTKYDESDGTIRIYDPKTGAFAAYRRDGRTRTYFKPGGRDYFQRQPGKTVRLKRPQN